MAPYFIVNPRLRAFTRFVRTLGYLACAVAGGIIIAVGFPPFGPFYVLLGWFCLAGGILAGGGTLTGRWVGELLGLPLLTSAMVSFALVTFRESAGDPWVGAPSVGLLVSFAALLLGRWIDVFSLSRTATRASRS